MSETPQGRGWVLSSPPHLSEGRSHRLRRGRRKGTLEEGFRVVVCADLPSLRDSPSFPGLEVFSRFPHCSTSVGFPLVVLCLLDCSWFGWCFQSLRVVVGFSGFLWVWPVCCWSGKEDERGGGGDERRRKERGGELLGKRRFVAKGEQMCALFDFLKVLQTFCFQAKNKEKNRIASFWALINRHISVTIATPLPFDLCVPHDL